jgi:hypothetical protein
MFSLFEPLRNWLTAASAMLQEYGQIEALNARS